MNRSAASSKLGEKTRARQYEMGKTLGWTEINGAQLDARAALPRSAATSTAA